MCNRNNTDLTRGILSIAAFSLWTILVQTVDVQPAGAAGTGIGFASLNLWFHHLTGVHTPVYLLTDWLGLVPLSVCLLFAAFGCVQWIRRKDLRKVDTDILLLGLYYLAVILIYLLFEQFPVNYRPILIEGRMEASYPSSTTLLVLSVMPTLSFQTDRRSASVSVKGIVRAGTVIFSLLMVVGRLLCGVHWFTDIIGSVLLSLGLFSCYKGILLHGRCYFGIT